MLRIWSAETRYTDGDIGKVEIVDDFLPPPHALVKREETVKVTLSLSKEGVDFFKQQAAQYNVPYQRMIRALVDDYARRHEVR